jgi:DNA-binding CsgD family transcriptional regulator
VFFQAQIKGFPENPGCEFFQLLKMENSGMRPVLRRHVDCGVCCVRLDGCCPSPLLDEGICRREQCLVEAGLTLRQAVVALWIAEGKRNKEIAVIMGISSRTVEKHVEAIVNTLGVETRTAAAVRVIELMDRAGACRISPAGPRPVVPDVTSRRPT